MSSYSCKHISIDTHIVLAHNARTHIHYWLKKGTNGCMIEGCLTCVHLTMFTTILSKCSLMFWSLILLFGQVITIPINPKPVNPTPSIRPFKPSFDEECVEATIWYFDVNSGHITLDIRFSGDWKALQISLIDLTFGFLGDGKTVHIFFFFFCFFSIFSKLSTRN